MKYVFCGVVGLFARALADDSRDRQAQLAEPGAHHKQLIPFVGTWQVTGKCFAKNKQGDPVSGSVTSDWVLGSRFVRCNAKFTEGDKAIEGIGMTGYDNAQRKYVSSWQDTKCTGIKLETGDYDSGSKTFTFSGEFKNEKGETIRCRKLINDSSESEYSMTAFLTEPGQQETKAAELTFNRTGGG